MKLTLENIKKIANGAVRVESDDVGIRLYRFTEEQEELYRISNDDFYMKNFSTSGIKLWFKTNSRELYLKIFTTPASSRRYFSVDVFSNDKLVGCLDNFSEKDLPENYVQGEYPLGSFSKSFSLGDGEKEVCIYLPWSVGVAIEEMSLDDGATIKPIKMSKKILAFGDSITHGYDAIRPSNRYMAKLSKKLEAEEFNKAIGGEVFFPELAKLRDDFTPDYITVAYGTNDWNRLDEETFKANCRAFFENLLKNYPNSKVFAITPIWRKDMNEEREFGDFKRVEEDIKSIAEAIGNIIVISGFGFVPEDEKFFADQRLHPNDKGFEHYEKHLYEAVLPYL